ncbi:unnamed protein product, partial [Gulo gulo]
TPPGLVLPSHTARSPHTPRSLSLVPSHSPVTQACLVPSHSLVTPCTIPLAWSPHSLAIPPRPHTLTQDAESGTIGPKEHSKV